MKKKRKKKMKRHIKWKAIFMFLFIVFIIYCLCYYFFNLPIKNIYIVGNDVIKDYEIIEVSGLKEYPKLNKYATRTIEKKVTELDLVTHAHVKKNLLGKITIQIEEASVLFYNRNNSTYVLSNGYETVVGDYIGIPILINYVQSDVYERLIKELAKVKKESLALISEIEYSRSMSGDIVLDDTRFLLRMNDGNQVYINLIHMDRLDMYALTYTTIPQKKGILYLDSDNDRVLFGDEEKNEAE